MNEIRPGVWSFRVSLGTDPVTGRRIQQRVTTVGTRADAVRRYREIEADKLARSHPSSAITLATVRTFWDETTQRQSRRRETTARMEESAYRRYLDPLLGQIPLHRLTPEVITRAYDELSRTLSPGSIRRLHQQLSSILQWATKRGYVPRAETERVDVPRAKRSLPEAPTLDDVMLLLASAEHDDDLWLMIRLASNFGLRRGELAALQIGDINIQDQTIRVSKSVVAISGQRPKVVPPKTGESGCAVYQVDDELLKELIIRRTELRSIALAMGVPLESMFLFTGSHPGEPRRPDYFTRKITIHKAKNPELAPVILKALRNFTGSELAEDEVDLMTSKTVLRHTDHNTTARHYIAPRERNVRRATVRLGKKLGGRTRTA